MAGFGVFGKMPALGDFLRIDPPVGFVEAWDPWLQARLLDLSEVMGTSWRKAYLGAPIWRFTASAGLAGPAQVLGVLMPSVDRVGRDFPLTLVTAVSGAGSVFGVHAASDGVFAALEEVALAALGDGVSPERLSAALAGVAPPEASRESAVIGRGPGHLAVLAADGAAPALLDASARCWTRPSVWSAVLDAGTRLMLSEGLPGPERARALFDLDAPLWTREAATSEIGA